MKKFLTKTITIALLTTATANAYNDCSYIDHQTILSKDNYLWVEKIADGEIGSVSKDLWYFRDYLFSFYKASLNNSKLCHSETEEYLIKDSMTREEVSNEVHNILKAHKIVR